MKVLFCVSTLGASGPTNQLLNLSRHVMAAGVQPLVLTLSKEPKNTLLPAFHAAGIDVETLAFSRVEGLFRAKSVLAKKIDYFSPDVVHTQGLRADVALASFGLHKWVATARNYPWEDYPMKFGKTRGALMAWQHLRALAKCRHLVSCSRSIAARLTSHQITSVAIQNGVEVAEATGPLPDRVKSLPYPWFITAGSLIARKNTGALISAFKEYSRNGAGTLLVLGDGPERDALTQSAAGHRIHFAGNVTNVSDYLRQSSCFVSASRSEGLPNSVLEAFACGIPAILSDIPSHREIHQDAPRLCEIYDETDQTRSLTNMMKLFASGQTLQNAGGSLSETKKNYSADRMSNEYLTLYTQVAGGE